MHVRELFVSDAGGRGRRRRGPGTMRVAEGDRVRVVSSRLMVTAVIWAAALAASPGIPAADPPAASVTSLTR